MTYDSARSWILYATLAATAASFVFFTCAPALGYPLGWDQAIRLLEILLPTFLAYVGSAARFVVGAAGAQEDRRVVTPAFRILVRGPVIVFAVAVAALLTAFYLSNRGGALPGSGMTIDAMAGVLSAALGILTVTTSVLTEHLFGAAARGAGHAEGHPNALVTPS